MNKLNDQLTWIIRAITQATIYIAQIKRDRKRNYEAQYENKFMRKENAGTGDNRNF